MTSKLVVNTIEADTGISSVSFASSISMSSTSKFHFGNAGIDIGADTNINRPASGVLGFNINSSEKVRIDSSGQLGIGTNSPKLLLHLHQENSNATFAHFTNSTTGINANQGVSFGLDSNEDATIYHYGSKAIRFATGGTEKVRISDNGAIGLGGANYGSSGQVLTSGGSGSAVTWSTVSGTTINNNADNRLITGSGTANTLEAESGFTFNGSLASIINSSGPTLELTTNTNAANASLRLHEGATGSTSNGGGMFYSGADNKLHITCGTNLTTERVTILRDSGYVGINENTPSNQLHIAGTTGNSAGGLLRLDATTGDNFIIFDNTGDSSEWVIGNDSGSNDEFRMYYNGGSGYGHEIVNVDGTTNNGKVTIDGGTNTLVIIRADSAGTAGLRLGGQAGSGTDQCTGYVEVHQDEQHGGGMFYNGDGSPSFATGEAADYFSLYRFSSGVRHSVMRWFHSSNDCHVQGNMYIDNGTSTILRVRGDSAGTAGVSAGGETGSGTSQCTGYLECHQDQIHGGGISYNGDGSPSFANFESADHVTFYRMDNGTRTRVFHYGYNSNSVNFRGGISASSKSFRITHPHPSKKDTHDLVHSSIEGPQADNIYRGKVDLVGGTATVNIDTTSNMTDGTFVLLNRDIQCFTSNETGWTAVKGSVSGNLLTITAQDNSCTDTISWMVVGERQDDNIKSSDVDTTDSDGKLIVEPLKGS